MSSASRFQLAVLYPELLGTYGDGGNVLVLRRRLEWRGIACDVVAVPLGEPVPGDCDLYVLGGGEDDAQSLAMEGLRESSGLLDAARKGTPIFAVCAGLQLLGTTFTTTRGGVERGLGLLDASTVRRSVRAVGEVVAEPLGDEGLPVLTGFENHGGGTTLGSAARPLARVLRGVGNGGTGTGADDPRTRDAGPGDPGEGAVQDSIIATYLHGPVLARNPALADLLLTRGIGSALPDLPSPEVDALRAALLGSRSGQ